MSNSDSSSSSGSYKRRINQIDDTIEHLTQEVKSLNNYVNKTEFECSLMTIKMKREKLTALSAIARAQVIMADMQVRLAEGELSMDVQKLKNFKKMRLDHEEGAFQRHTCELPVPPSTATVSVQTTGGTTEKKKYRRHSSSRKSQVDNSSSRKSQVDNSSLRSPVDIFTDDTIIIPSIHENTPSPVENSVTSQTSFYLELFGKTPPKRSSSEISLSNSVKDDFNNSFTQTQIKGTAENSPGKQHKKSKTQSHRQKSTSVSISKETQPRPKTVADLKKIVDTSKSSSADKKSMANATFVPARHNNLPQIVPRPSTSAMTPTTQSNLHPQDPRPYRLLPIDGIRP